jgi:hypothetical protein
VPRIQLSDSAILNEYRQGLHPSEQSVFDQIVASLKHPVGTLAWYHHLGDLLRQLQGMMQSRKAYDLARLAEVLGLGDTLLTRSQRFVKLYPKRELLEELETIGTDWTRLTLAFSIRDRKERLDFLRNAEEKEWSIPELREQLHKQFPTNRKGVGGRKRTERLALPTVGRVRELVRLCHEWNHIHERLPPKARASAWGGYARTLSEEKLKELVGALEELGTSLKDGLHVLRLLAKKR